MHRPGTQIQTWSINKEINFVLEHREVSVARIKWTMQRGFGLGA